MMISSAIFIALGILIVAVQSSRGDECYYETFHLADLDDKSQDASTTQQTIPPTQPSPLGPSDSLFTTEEVPVIFEDPLAGMTPFSPDDPTVIQSETVPQRINYMPEVGNGHVATAIETDSMYMNGLYNGANLSSHRARIPSTVAYRLYGFPADFNTTYTLNMGKGFFTESHSGDGVDITLTTFAHRVWTRVIVCLLTLSRKDVNNHVEAFVHLGRGDHAKDIDFYRDDQGTLRGQTKVAEYPELAPRTTFYMKTSASLVGHRVMSPGAHTETIAAFTVIDVSKEKVLEEYDEAIKAFKNSTLLSSHVKEWEAMWKRGRIDVEGNLTLSKINYAAQYYLLSSLPFKGNRKDWPFVGLSPGGLANGGQYRDYRGHVFWDQDIWMSPGLSLLHSDIGKLLLETRTRTLNAARLFAWRTGFRGARFPWESAFTGLEVCPAHQYSEMEIHITGDVAMMMRQYWYLTKDRAAFLEGGAYGIVTGAAEFFASRVVFDSQLDAYRILDVMPPDEYHYPVNDSVYTNAIARNTLNFANELSRALGKPENSTWTRIADKLRILYDPVLDYNPEYEGFVIGEYTKQADVVLLPYPLMVSLNASTRTNNLLIYEESTPIGPAPAMTWSMFLLNWLLLGNETKAAELFRRSMLNVQQPFLIWTENSDGTGATNFLTGMGGHLQSLLFGYGGCRFFEDHLAFDPIMIPTTSSVTFSGADYMGCSFDLHYTDDNITLTLRSIGQSVGGLEVSFSTKGIWQTLCVDTGLTAQRQPFKLRATK